MAAACFVERGGGGSNMSNKCNMVAHTLPRGVGVAKGVIVVIWQQYALSRGVGGVAKGVIIVICGFVKSCTLFLSLIQAQITAVRSRKVTTG